MLSRDPGVGVSRAYRFNLVLVGIGGCPQEAFRFALERLHSSPLEALDGDVVFAEIEDPSDLAEQLGKLLSFGLQQPDGLL